MNALDRTLARVGLLRSSKAPVEKQIGTVGPLSRNSPMEWFQTIGQSSRSANNMNSATVFGIVSAYAGTIGQCSIHHYKTNEDGSRERMPTTNVSLLLSRPNSYQTRSDLILNLIHGMFYEGNGYVVAVDGSTSRNSSSLHLLEPRATTAERVTGPDGPEIFYRTSGVWAADAGADTAVRIPQRFVGHLKMFTPSDPLVGITPIANAGAAIAASNAIADASAAYHLNQSRPSGVLSTELNLTGTQMRELRLAWEEQAKGLAAGGVPILSNGLKWEALSLSAHDSETIASWRMSVEEIARAFNIPLPVIGSLEHATLNNAETLIQLWLSQGLGFLIEHIEQMFAKLFQLPFDQGIEIDTSVLLRTNFEARMKGLATAVAGGIYSPNEARAKEFLPPVEGGNLPRMQMQNVPLDYVAPEPIPPAAPAETEDVSEEEIDEALEATP